MHRACFRVHWGHWVVIPSLFPNKLALLSTRTCACLPDPTGAVVWTFYSPLWNMVEHVVFSNLYQHPVATVFPGGVCIEGGWGEGIPFQLRVVDSCLFTTNILFSVAGS